MYGVENNDSTSFYIVEPDWNRLRTVKINTMYDKREKDT